MRIIVVSDIFGYPSAQDCVSGLLPNVSDIRNLSMSAMSGRPELTGEALHRYLFEGGGMQTVTNALAALTTETYIGIGYSAGGTALWRAVALGMPLLRLFCISSTRLRTESKIPVPNHVFFGGKDTNRPTAGWLSTVPTRATVFDDAEHDYYRSATSPETVRTGRMIESYL